MTARVVTAIYAVESRLASAHEEVTESLASAEFRAEIVNQLHPAVSEVWKDGLPHPGSDLDDPSAEQANGDSTLR